MLVVFGFAAGSAFAAAPQTDKSVETVAKKKKKKKKKKGSANAETTKAYRSAVLSARKGMSGSAATAPSPAAPSQTTAAPLTESTKEAAIKRWAFMLDSWNEFNSQATNMGHGDVDGYQALRVTYLATPTLSLSVTGLWENSFGATTGNQKVFMTLDPYLMVAKTELLGALPSGLTSTGYMRFYPGVSEDSRNKGQVGALRGDFTFGRDLGKVVHIGLEVQPRYYFQTQPNYMPKTQISDDGKPVGDAPHETPNMQARIAPFGNMTLTFSKMWSFYQNAGVDYVWYYSDPDSTYTADKKPTPQSVYPNRDVAHKEFFYGESGLTFTANDNFAVTAGIYTDLARNLLDQKDDFRFYNDADSLYFLDATVTF